MRTIETAGLTARTASQSSPKCGRTRGEKFSMIRSLCRMSSSAMSSSFGTGQFEAQRTLVGVAAQIDRPPLPPLVPRRRSAIGEPHPVGTPDTLDLDDVGSKRSEHRGGHRTGPERGQIQDSDAGQRKRRFDSRGSALADRAVSQCDSARVGAQLGSGQRGTGGDCRTSVRYARMDRAVGCRREHSTLDEVIDRHDRVGCRDGGDRDAQRRRRAR